MEAGDFPPEEGEQRSWLKHLEEEARGSPGSGARRRGAAESLQAIRAQKLSKQLFVVWALVLALSTGFLGVHLGARNTKRGKDNAMWLITVALMDYSLMLGSLLLSGIGVWLRDEIYMRQSSMLQVITASWYVIELAFNMAFVVILSKIGGEWQRHGKYTTGQIEKFNTFITILVVLGCLLAPLTFLGSRLSWNLSKVYEVDTVVRKFPERNEMPYQYGTFKGPHGSSLNKSQEYSASP
ncbi:transmembrane protein [Cyclospora cayetanensis]|nr:transmembrane protein [Cyclospora cayetanensis]